MNFVESEQISEVHKRLTKHVVAFDRLGCFVELGGLSTVDDEVSSLLIPMSVPLFVLNFMSSNLSKFIGFILSLKLYDFSSLFTLSFNDLSFTGVLCNHIEVQRMTTESILFNGSENVANA